MEGGTRHRKGPLSQSNRSFKSRHATKGSIKRKQGGKIEGGGRASLKASVASGKTQRFNRAQQLRQQKRDSAWLQKRLGSDSSAPKIVALIGLGPEADVQSVRAGMIKLAASTTDDGGGVGAPVTT